MNDCLEAALPVPRILIFSHDGRGLGHLRRLSHLGSALQGEASVLFITGMREASWIVPPSCEFVHLPSRDSLASRRSQQWLREPFIPEGSFVASNLRPQIIRATVEAFQPDALIVDYLPLGIEEELSDLVFGLPLCKKYYISRGILGSPETLYADILTPKGLDALKNRFSRIVVMSDIRIIDTVHEYGFDAALAAKVTYTGYAVTSPSKKALEAARRARNIPIGAAWIVCSAGGGKDGEDLIQRCWEISRLFPDAFFDIVAGPRSRLQFTEPAQYGARVAVVDANPASLALMHAAADVVITRGGYNSLLESSVGSAKIIVVPISYDYEQREHARRLSAYREMTMVHTLDDLDVVLERVLDSPAPTPLNSAGFEIEGSQVAAKLILEDLLTDAPVSMNEESYEWSHSL